MTTRGGTLAMTTRCSVNIYIVNFYLCSLSIPFQFVVNYLYISFSSNIFSQQGFMCLIMYCHAYCHAQNACYDKIYIVHNSLIGRMIISFFMNNNFFAQHSTSL